MEFPKIIRARIEIIEYPWPLINGNPCLVKVNDKYVLSKIRLYKVFPDDEITTECYYPVVISGYNYVTEKQEKTLYPISSQLMELSRRFDIINWNILSDKYRIENEAKIDNYYFCTLTEEVCEMDKMCYYIITMINVQW